MERNFADEIDALRREIEQLKSDIHGSDSQAPISKMMRSVPKETLPEAFHNDSITKLFGEIEKLTAERGDSGAVSYVGTMMSSGRQSIWASHAVPTDSLLRLNEDHRVEKVLASIGNEKRLAILLSLLKKPNTVAQIVDELGFNTTGQAYHHLKPLMAADIVEEVESGERGIYAVKPHRVQGLIMLLAGVHDMVDPQYSSGSWDETE